MSKSIQELQREAHRIAVEHGFGKASFGERIALIHSEASEALEEYRKGVFSAEHEAELLVWVAEGIDSVGAKSIKPNGVTFELADIVIRVLDMAEAYRLDLGRAIDLKMQVNEARPWRHGGKAL